MITLPANTRIWIAAGVTDLRRGFVGLSALVQTALEQDPFSGHVFVFRGRRYRCIARSETTGGSSGRINIS
jgi:transposase